MQLIARSRPFAFIARGGLGYLARSGSELLSRQLTQALGRSTPDQIRKFGYEKKSFPKRLGFVRNAIGKDLLFFFFPWLTAMLVELNLCGKWGHGLSGFWRILWELVTHPQNLFVFPSYRTIGLSLFVVGLTIMIVGQATLWKNYSGFVVIKKDHQLITHGIYRFTRNPIYLGAIIVFSGLPVFAASVYGFLAMFAQIPIYLFRIKMEEKLLAEHFGDEYESYRNTTKRLIPFLY